LRPIRSLKPMRTAGSPTNRLSGWSVLTNSETPDCLRSKAIRSSRICATTRDTPHFSRECACQHKAARLFTPRTCRAMVCRAIHKRYAFCSMGHFSCTSKPIDRYSFRDLGHGVVRRLRMRDEASFCVLLCRRLFRPCNTHAAQKSE
jgi:hypothetical protein